MNMGAFKLKMVSNVGSSLALYSMILNSMGSLFYGRKSNSHVGFLMIMMIMVICCDSPNRRIGGNNNCQNTMSKK